MVRFQDGGRVAVPVRVTLGSGDAVRGMALFAIRDGKVAAFEVGTDLVR
jgi:hypothetical protein